MDALVCIGCIGTIAAGGGLNPGFMALFVVRYIAFAETCSLACLMAVL